MKARIPSRWSSVAKSSKKAARSARRPALSDRSAAASTERLAARTASGGMPAIVSASSRAASTVWALGYDLRDEPSGLRLLGRHRPPGQDQLHGQRRADGPGEPLRAAGPGHDPDPDLRLAELGVVAGDDEVARHGQLAAAAQGVAAHGGDQRQADRADTVPGREVALGVQALGGLVGELHDVGTGREGSIAGTRQDDDPDAIVEVERLELVGQLGQEREAERVARLGSIDRDERDAVMPGNGGIDADQAGGRLDVGHGLLAGRPVKYPRSGKSVVGFPVDAVATVETPLGVTRPTDCHSCRIGDRVTAHIGGEDRGCPTLGA